MSILLNRAVLLLLLLFSALALIVPGLANACLFLLALCGVAALAGRVAIDGQCAWAICRRHWPLMLALALPLLAVVLHQIAAGDFHDRDIDRPMRLALFGLVLAAVLSVPLRQLKWLPWAWMSAALLALGKAWWVTKGGSLPNTGSLGFMAAIAFSNMALLVGVWLLLARGLLHGRLARMLALLAVVLALAVTFMVKTRGTWLVLPFYAIFFVWYLRDLRWWQRVAIILLPLLMLGAAVHQSSMVRERIYAVQSDLQQYASGANRDTSVGQRLEIWRASWQMFIDHPLLGVGRQQFKPELYRLAAQGQVTSSIVELPHSHNGILFQMALWGSGGLLAQLLVYLVPFIYFLRSLRHPDAGVRRWAAMGAAMCIGFWVFDLTDVMFFWVMLNGFYAINLALFVSAIYQGRRAWQQSQGAIDLA
jgi:O-antigen ligase